MYQKASRLPWVALLSGRPAEKKPSEVSFQNCDRSVRMPFLIYWNTSSGTPSGLLSDLIITGGMAESRTAERTRSVPCRPM